MSGSDLDFSLRGAPPEWTEVEKKNAEDRVIARPKASPPRPKVTRKPSDMFSGTVFALVVSAISSVGWFVLERNSPSPLPWLAVPVALAIVVAIRLGAGPGEQDIRAILAATLYLLTVIVAAVLVSNYQFQSIFGTSPSLAELDHWLVRTRLEDPMTMLNWVGGFWASIHLSYRLGGDGRE